MKKSKTTPSRVDSTEQKIPTLLYDVDGNKVNAITDPLESEPCAHGNLDVWYLYLIETRWPTLNLAGWWCKPENRESYKFGVSNISEVRESMRWLTYHATQTKTIRKSVSSYGYKHFVENTCGEYISNGAFIAGALLMGYKYEMCSNGVNCFFNIHVGKTKHTWMHMAFKGLI